MSTTECPLPSPSQPSSELSDAIHSDVMDCSVADDEFLVQVRAQVMTRDDSSGGWLPRNGGGMSIVGVQAAAAPTNSHYMIRGRRVCDQAVVLDCAITDDLLYEKANPIFHHWRTRGKRFGLTFHSSADAQIFETCIQHATQQLQDRSPYNKQDGCEDEDGEEDTMMKLRSAADAKEISSLPASRTRTPSPCATMRVRGTAVPQRKSSSFACTTSYYPFSCPHLDFVGDRSVYGRHASSRQEQLLRKSNVVAGDPLRSQPGNEVPASSDDAPVRSDGYVRFSRTDISAESAMSVASGPSQTTPKSNCRLADTVLALPSSSHVYEYPVVLPSAHDSSLPPTIQQVSLPRRKLRKSKKSQKRSVLSSTRARCVYCQELFFVSENRSGVCPDAPNDCAACIEHATCLCAARALLYHCATDDDGNYGSVCGAGESSSPGSGSSSERRRRRKWVLLALLSIVLPCLWCYPALTACQRCAVVHVTGPHSLCLSLLLLVFLLPPSPL